MLREVLTGDVAPDRGHLSLQAIWSRCLPAIQETLGVVLPAGQLLAAPTIAAMAAVITDALVERSDEQALDRVLAHLQEQARKEPS